MKVKLFLYKEELSRNVTFLKFVFEDILIRLPSIFLHIWCGSELGGVTKPNNCQLSCTIPACHLLDNCQLCCVIPVGSAA